jgi:diguanylate cyclase (GGDEF)-like protein
MQRLSRDLLSDPGGLLTEASSRLTVEAPDYAALLLEHGEDLGQITYGLLSVLGEALATEATLEPYEFWDRIREMGRLRCEQGLALETLLEVLNIHRRVLLEAIERQAAGAENPGPLLLVAERRLDLAIQKLTLSFTRGYLDRTEQRYLEQHRELEALIKIARAVNRSLELRDVAEAGLAETLRVFGLEAGALWMVAGDGKLALVATEGIERSERESLAAMEASQSPITSRALESMEPVQMRVEPRLRRLGGPLSAMAIALRAKGETLGVLAVGTRQMRVFSEAELAFISAVADQIAVALEHAREHWRESRTDYLTGLANRPEFERAFQRELAAAQRRSRPVTLVLMDLDQLKHLNDTYGHHVGDEAIRSVADALRRVVRASDISARLGGDEFALAMPETVGAQAEEAIRRVKEALRTIGRSGRLPLPIQLSFGVCQWERGLDQGQMFKLADARLYREKRRHHAARRQGAAEA